MSKNHIIISGTGRAGTTFLVWLFTRLGLDTGFDPTNIAIDRTALAGLEKELNENAPYIIKRPHFCDDLDTAVQDGRFIFEHAIIPIRDLYQAAESRRDVVRKAPPSSVPSQVTGGLFGTDNPGDQEAVLAQKFYDLMHAIAKHKIPLTLLHYPTLKTDPDYLFEKLTFMLKGISKAHFQRAYAEVYNPDFGHNFTKNKTQLPKLRLKGTL